MRQRLTVLVMVVGLMLFGATPAFAGGWVSCDTGGYGYTYSSAFADHHFGSSTKTNIKGTTGHGFFIGQQYWDVNNPNPPSESGSCAV